MSLIRFSPPRLSQPHSLGVSAQKSFRFRCANLLFKIHRKISITWDFLIIKFSFSQYSQCICISLFLLFPVSHTITRPDISSILMKFFPKKNQTFNISFQRIPMFPFYSYFFFHFVLSFLFLLLAAMATFSLTFILSYCCCNWI